MKQFENNIKIVIFPYQTNSSAMSLKFVTRKLKTQTLGDDEGDLNEVKEKDVASGDNLKPESSKTDVSIVNIYFSRE